MAHFTTQHFSTNRRFWSQMSEDRKKPGVAFWATAVLVVVLVGYPLSFGPIFWLIDNGFIPHQPAYRVYRPALKAALSSDVFQRYCNCYGASRRQFLIQDAALEYIR